MSNEFKLSHGSRERKRRQSITLTAIEIERLASEGELCFHFILHNLSFNLFIRRLGVGCSDWLGDAVASARAHVAQMHRTPRSLVGTASSMSTVSLMFVHQQALTDSPTAMTQRLG
jgi:hypothetical protein